MILFTMTVSPPEGSKLHKLERISQGHLKPSRKAGPCPACATVTWYRGFSGDPGVWFPDLLPRTSWMLSLMRNNFLRNAAQAEVKVREGQRKQGHRGHRALLSLLSLLGTPGVGLSLRTWRLLGWEVTKDVSAAARSRIPLSRGATDFGLEANLARSEASRRAEWP